MPAGNEVRARYIRATVDESHEICLFADNVKPIVGIRTYQKMGILDLIYDDVVERVAPSQDVCARLVVCPRILVVAEMNGVEKSVGVFVRNPNAAVGWVAEDGPAMGAFAASAA
jgi:hypothetical protein